MSLFELLSVAQLEARKAHDTLKLSVLQVTLSAVKNVRIQKQQDLTEDDVLSVVQHQVKQLKDALTDFEKAGRQDLIAQTKNEIEILSSFLPKQLSETEIQTIAQRVIDETHPQGPSDFGKVMGLVMRETKGRADGTLVRTIVTQLLS